MTAIAVRTARITERMLLLVDRRQVAALARMTKCTGPGWFQAELRMEGWRTIAINIGLHGQQGTFLLLAAGCRRVTQKRQRFRSAAYGTCALD